MNLNGTRLFIFDLDGTLVNSFEDIACAVNYSLEKLRFQPVPASEIRQYVGNGVYQLMKDILEKYSGKIEVHESLIEQAVSFWKEYYLAHPADQARLYPGAKELLVQLKKKGIHRAILTNKEHEVALTVMRALNISEEFDYILGDRSEIPRKPSPEGLYFLMKKYGVSSRETWMVGDGEMDIRAGLAADCFVCGVSYGLSNRQELFDLGANIVIDSLEELIREIN